MIEFAAFVRFDTVATCGSVEEEVIDERRDRNRDSAPITSKWSITASVSSSSQILVLSRDALFARYCGSAEGPGSASLDELEICRETLLCLTPPSDGGRGD